MRIQVGETVGAEGGRGFLLGGWFVLVLYDKA